MHLHEHGLGKGRRLRPTADRVTENTPPRRWQGATCGSTDTVGRTGSLALQRTLGDTSGQRLVDGEDRKSVPHVIGSGGEPLEKSVRTDMEARLGHDFSDVRVHTDDAASRSAVSVNAHAYTVGSDVVFQRNQYDPSSAAGRTMLAHELIHVVQQRSGPVSGTLTGSGIRVSAPSDRFEREAAATAERAMSGPTAAPPFLMFQRSAGTAAVTMVRDGQDAAASGQRRDETLPGQGTGHGDASVAGTASIPTVQRACVEDADGKKHWEYEYDGCSLWYWASLRVGDFTLSGPAKDNPAGGGDRTAFAFGKPTTEGGVGCDRHDECYQSCGANKDVCDRRMDTDMRAICAAAPSEHKQKCYASALLYYKGLQAFGRTAFDDRQKEVCACDPQKIPPWQSFPPLELLLTPGTRRPLGWLQYLLLPSRFTGYKAFRNREEYERYLEEKLSASRPALQESDLPSILRMR